MKPESSLPCSQQPANSEDPCNIRNKLFFHGDDLSIPNQEDRHKSTKYVLLCMHFSSKTRGIMNLARKHNI
jgi:hypothetical protein